MDELLARIAAEDFDEDGAVRIRQSAATEAGITLGLDLLVNGATEHWTVECEMARTYRIGRKLAYRLQLLTDHVLLAPYVDSHVTLATYGAVADVRHAIADLWQAHQDLADDWFPMSAFLRAESLGNLLRSSSAIVAEGPSRFITVYRNALASNGTDAYTPWQRPPVQWRAGAWQPESPNLSLLLLPPHFIVGSGFSARPGHG